MSKSEKSRRDTSTESNHKPKPATGPLTLLIATRKGAFFLRGGKNRGKWKLSEPIFLGHMVHHIVQDPRDPETAWVFPMDGTEVWPRTSPDGKPAAYVTHDAGESWKRLDKGLPRKHAWLTVKRQAMTADSHDPVGLYFGTTSGEVGAALTKARSGSASPGTCLTFMRSRWRSI